MAVDVKKLSRDKVFGEHLNGQIFVAGNKKYTLGGKIGNGAIGVVRRATEHGTNKTVAVKFLAPEIRYIDETSIEDIYRRFKREGERGVNLDHSNLVQIIAYEENVDGHNFLATETPCPTHPFIIMEYIQGRTLEEYIRKDKGIPRKEFCFSRETLHIAINITKSLVYLHKHSLVHRDVKPANIFLSKSPPSDLPKTIKLGDFGVVKWGDFTASISTGTLTVTGQQGLGTLKYMASEQSLDPQNVDFKCDVFSLGITLYELFTNQILPDIHHVIQIRDVRMKKRNIYSRLSALNIPFPHEVQRYEPLIDLIFDTFLKKSGRPTSTKIHNILNSLLYKMDDPYYEPLL